MAGPKTFSVLVRAGLKTFRVLGESINVCLFSYSNVFFLIFFVAKDSFINKVL